MRLTRRLREYRERIISKEKGTVIKDPGGRAGVSLVYPNRYEAATTNLGFQTLYHLINGLDRALAERAFLPEGPVVSELERTGTPLFSIESGRPVKEFDIVAFSVSFEEDYVNIPRILALSGIPVRASERRGGPLVVAGGIAPSLNPEPLSEMVDLFIIGEAEGAVEAFFDLYMELDSEDREELKRGLDALDFVYVPSLYRVAYEGPKVTSFTPLSGAKQRIKAHKIFSLDPWPVPSDFVHTPENLFGGARLFEIERGCGRGCRFCAAGFVCLPPRERKKEDVMDAVFSTEGKVGLVGTAVSEYSALREILSGGIERGLTMTLSSLRLDVLDPELLALLKRAGYRTVTMAPEAGSVRMRHVVNKAMSDEDILRAARLVTEAGFRRIKLYFLIGLPTETDRDVLDIVSLSKEIKDIMGGGSLTLSVNPFVPKPSTPFQWHPFERVGVLKKRLGLIKDGFRGTRGVTVKAMGPEEAFFQAFISRGDRRAADVIIDASTGGIRRAARNRRAFMEEQVYRMRSADEILPWDMIDHGFKEGYLWREYRRGLEGRLTEPCRVGLCFRCGVCSPEMFAGVRAAAD